MPSSLNWKGAEGAQANTRLQAAPSPPIQVLGLGKQWDFLHLRWSWTFALLDMPGGRGTVKAHRIWNQMGFFLLQIYITVHGARWEWKSQFTCKTYPETVHAATPLGLVAPSK